METNEMYGVTIDWNAPDGNIYTLREQNGADDDVLSNQAKARDLTNVAEFLAGIVVGVNNGKKKMSVSEILNLPLNVKYGLALKSRIFSLGEELDFEYTWPDEDHPCSYSIDLTQFLFEDYHKLPTQEELVEKPDAIPYYVATDTEYQSKDIEIELSTGKKLKFDRFNGYGERQTLKMVENKSLTNNKPLEVRNLRLYLNGEYVKVSSFHMFSAREMKEMKSMIYTLDPVFSGAFKITHPSKENLTTEILLFGISDFFFPGEV